MQSTIFFLQQELKQAKDTISSLESEVNLLRTSNDNNGYSTTNTSLLTNDYTSCVDGGKNISSENTTTLVNGQTIIKSELLDVNSLNNENILSERTNLNNGIKHLNNKNCVVLLNSVIERTTIKNYCNGEMEIGDDNDINDDRNNGSGGIIGGDDINKIQKSAVTKIKCNEQNDNLSSNLSNYICKPTESTDTLKLTISLPKRQRTSNYDSDSSEYSNNDNNAVDHTHQHHQQQSTIVANTTTTGATTRTRSRKPIKKQRRTSISTYDFQDEDTDMVTEMEENNPPEIVSGGGKMLRSKSNGTVKKLRSKVDAD